MNSCIYRNVCKDFNTPACKTCEYHTPISHYKPRHLWDIINPHINKEWSVRELGVPVRTWYRDVTAGDSAHWVARFL